VGPLSGFSTGPPLLRSGIREAAAILRAFGYERRLAMRRLFGLLALLAAVGVIGAEASAIEPGQRAPTRLYSMGDSITRAFDAQLPYDNLNNSWVNGYYGFWQWLLRLPNIRSHNQLISANFGLRGRKNYIAAENGARVDDLASQARGAAGRDITYATVMLGGNDVCRDRISDLPTDAEFRADFEAGMDILLANLPPGATAYVAAIPDIKRLYDIGKDKSALGIVRCEWLWALTVLGFPCGSMLSRSNDEGDRLYVQQRNIGYNQILEEVTLQKAALHNDKFISFTDVSFQIPFQERDISNLDCYHPSSHGQKLLARETWNDGPFQIHQRGH
jgi:lysophospholipase L1-like esterase